VQKSLFHQAGLGIGAIHDCKITTAGSPGIQHLPDGINYKGSLGMVIHRFMDDNPVPIPSVGKQVLGGAVAVPVNYRPGGVQHRLGGTVILFQQDFPAFRVIRLKPQHIPIICAAPAVDGLIFIPHHEQVAMI